MVPADLFDGTSPAWSPVRTPTTFHSCNARTAPTEHACASSTATRPCGARRFATQPNTRELCVRSADARGAAAGARRLEASARVRNDSFLPILDRHGTNLCSLGFTHWPPWELDVWSGRCMMTAAPSQAPLEAIRDLVERTYRQGRLNQSE